MQKGFEENFNLVPYNFNFLFCSLEIIWALLHTYTKIEAIFEGGSLKPAKISLVRCRPEGILLSTGRPRRVTSSRKIN